MAIYSVKAEARDEAKGKAKDICKSWKKKDYRCRVRKKKKGCNKDWTKKDKKGDWLVCVKEKCNRECKKKAGIAAAKKECKSITKSTGRACKFIEPIKRCTKHFGKNWKKYKNINGQKQKKYKICLNENYDPTNKNHISSTAGSNPTLDGQITTTVQTAMNGAFVKNDIQKMMNKALCDAINDNRKPDPRLTINKCKSAKGVGIKIGSSKPTIIIKNFIIGPTLQDATFDYRVEWKTNGFKLNYTKDCKAKVRKKKGKGKKKDWKCPKINFKVGNFAMSLKGNGKAVMLGTTLKSVDLNVDNGSVSHNIRFSTCMKIFGFIKFCPKVAEGPAWKALKDALIDTIEDLSI